MRKIIYLLILVFFIPYKSLGDSYPEVIFDNSLLSGSYAKSVVNYTGDSWVENINNRLLISDTLFFTAGNSLSLKYISSKDGDWTARINYNRQKNYYRFNEKDQLSFFLFVKSKDTKIADLPRVYISFRDGSSDTVALQKYIVDYGIKKWVQVKIPAKVFYDNNQERVITGVGFVQNGSSDKEHHLFLDQIEFLPLKYSEVKLNSPAILVEAIPYDKMVHLKWQLPLSPSIRYVKIYRSTDGKDFKAVGMRPIHMQSCLDMVPTTGDSYFYKLAWVDYNYKESPESAVKRVETKALLNNDTIIDLIQAAHINYFVENFDINSGMYMPFRSKDKAVVSTKESAGAILSLIIGAEKNIVPRNVVLQRVSKMAYFLLKAQNRYGIYPAYFDGRKGVPEYRRGTSMYDVQATASLIEALLVAREYFNADEEIEKDLRNRITSLYHQINWRAISNGDYLLKPKFSHIDHDESILENEELPIHGVNDAINTYILAVSSPKYALPAESYFDAIYNNYGMVSVEKIDEIESDIYTDSITSDYSVINIDTLVYRDKVSKHSLFRPVYKYGVSVPFGEFSGSLIDMYKPFLTIKPSLLKDSLVNWDEVLNSYITYVKRRDNEVGVGALNSDIWGFYQHRDSVGNYRINPSIAPSAIIMQPEVGNAAILALYKEHGGTIFTEYGFKSWLDLRTHDESDEYLAMNQSTLAVMIENAKTGLIWKLYEKIPELKSGRDKLFNKPALELN